jgi:hypothetical protein
MTRRETITMTPTQFPRSDARANTAKLAKLGDVMMPEDAEEPILAPATRRAVFDWLSELRYRDELSEAKLKPRTSALLFGPPGCGKTMLAHHLAARLGVPMLACGAEHLTSQWVGAGEQKIAELFLTLDSMEGKVLLFLDEIDSVGTKRTSGETASGIHYNSSLTVILRRLERTPATVIAATNRPELLDAALFRRFGLQISIEIPGSDERWAIIKHYSAPYAFENGMIDELTALTECAAPSILRQIVEGLKRAIVLATPLRLPPPANAAEALAPVIASVRPPEEFGTPLLWEKGALDGLTHFPWPPKKDA